MRDNLDIRINWIQTLRINLTKLPFHQAIKFPILIYGWKSDISFNEIILDIPENKIKFGIIKIGCMFDVCTWSQYGSIIQSNGKFIVKGACVIGRGFSFWSSRHARFEIGANSVINGNCSIHCRENIKIGGNFSCAWNVSINDTDFHSCRDMDTSVLYSPYSSVVIGENVWIGQSANVLKGSVIPDWTIVNQRSLVNKKFTFEPYRVLAGIPARAVPNKHLRREDMYERCQYGDDFLITKGFNLFNLV